jgi:lipoprotein NlpD
MLLLALSMSGLAGCGSEPVQAPVSDARPPPAPPPAAAAPAAPPAAPAAASVPPGHHMVKRGDTLYSIALENGADYRDVARWNQLDDPTKISVGQVLRVAPPDAEPGVQVGAARGSGAVQARPLDGAALARQGQGDGATKVSPKALRLPYSEENVAMLAKGATGAAAVAVPRPAVAAPAPPTAAPAAPEPPKVAAVAREPDALDFIWPAQGGLLAKFAEHTSM